VTCKPITFEIHWNTPGGQYVKDGEQNWTPAVRRREKGRSMHSKKTISGPKNVSSDELDIGYWGCKAGVLSRAWQSSWPLGTRTLLFFSPSYYSILKFVVWLPIFLWIYSHYSRYSPWLGYARSIEG